MPRPRSHGTFTGPLDLFVEMGLPLVALVVLWMLSRRKGRGRDEAERRRAAGQLEYYVALGTDDLATLVGMLATRGDRTAEEKRVLAGAQMELERRRMPPQSDERRGRT